MDDLVIKEEPLEVKPLITVLKPETINNIAIESVAEKDDKKPFESAIRNKVVEVAEATYSKKYIIEYDYQLVCLICTKDLGDPNTFIRFKTREDVRKHFDFVHLRKKEQKVIIQQKYEPPSFEFVDCSDDFLAQPALIPEEPIKAKAIQKSELLISYTTLHPDSLNLNVETNKELPCSFKPTRKSTNERKEILEDIMSNKVFMCPLCVTKGIQGDANTKLETVIAVKNHFNFVHFQNLSFDEVKAFLERNFYYLKEKIKPIPCPNNAERNSIPVKTRKNKKPVLPVVCKIQAVPVESEKQKRLREIQKKLDELQKERDILLQANTSTNPLNNLRSVVSQSFPLLGKNNVTKAFENRKLKTKRSFLTEGRSLQKKANPIKNNSITKNNNYTPIKTKICSKPIRQIIVEKGSKVSVPVKVKRKRVEPEVVEIPDDDDDDVIDLTDEGSKDVSVTQPQCENILRKDLEFKINIRKEKLRALFNQL